MINKELKTWLVQNSAGIYRPSADAARLIDDLEKQLEAAKSALTKIRDIDYRGNAHESHYIAKNALAAMPNASS